MKIFFLAMVSIFLFTSALLFLRIKFEIELKNEILIRMNILGFKIQLYPEKKKKVKIEKFTKGYPKSRKKERSQITSKKENRDNSKEEKLPLGDRIYAVAALIRQLFSRLFKHLRLDVSKIIVVVGANDAATCAIEYGIISQSVAYLLEFLDNSLIIHKKRKGKIDVICDFTAKKTTYDIFIIASLNIWQILDIIISLVYNYFKGDDFLNLKKRFIGGPEQNGRK